MAFTSLLTYSVMSALVVNINLSLLYSYTVVYAETLNEPEKTYGFVVIIFIIGGISIGRGRAFRPPLATPLTM